jgi:hypothetical protein
VPYLLSFIWYLPAVSHIILSHFVVNLKVESGQNMGWCAVEVTVPLPSEKLRPLVVDVRTGWALDFLNQEFLGGIGDIKAYFLHYLTLPVGFCARR